MTPERPPTGALPGLRSYRSGRVLVLVMDRPAVRNALDAATSVALDEALTAAESDAAVKAVVLTGAGAKAFCAGMDLKSAAANGVRVMVEGRGFGGLTERGPYGKPIVAAVNGAAIAGGFELALSCDLVVAAEHATFALPEIRRGMAPARGLVDLARSLPKACALELLLTGRPIAAARARDLGLVNIIVRADRVVDEAVELASDVSAHAPLPVQHIKRMVDELPALAPGKWYDRNYESARIYLKSEDMQEGLRAFAEHRDPVWRGR